VVTEHRFSFPWWISFSSVLGSLSLVTIAIIVAWDLFKPLIP
jgi:hypothetical protein